MKTLPNDRLSPFVPTSVPGMKHGFDADHLATMGGQREVS
jgi:hypothetical protein